MTGPFLFLSQSTDAFVKTNPGYKLCPRTKQPLKAAVTKRRKPWPLAAGAEQDSLRMTIVTKWEMPRGIIGEIKVLHLKIEVSMKIVAVFTH